MSTSSAAAQPPVASASAAGSSSSAGPATSADFAADPRIHFNQQSGKWAFEADDGTEMEWEEARGVWVPVLEEDLVSAQQAAYSVAGVDESAPVAAVLAREAKKRKVDDPDSKNKKAKAPRAPPKATAVFVSGLPPSTTLTQLSSVFSKAGLILEDGDGDPRIKMYKNEQGHFKGEALIVYLQEASVELAIRLLDETELELGSGEGVMHVKKGEFQQRSSAEGGKGKERAEGAQKGSNKTELEKQKAGKRAEKLRQKLTDWSSDDEDATAAAKAKAKYSKLVVLQGMFTLQELEEDATLLLDLKEDVRDECETMGEVTNVTLYDKEETGIITVRFKEDIAAQACIAKMNGRFFGGRSIAAFLADGSKKYKKSGQGVDLGGTGFGDAEADREEEEKEKERLHKYAEWLEQDKGE